MQPKGGDVVGVLGTLFGVMRPQTVPGQPRSGGGRPGLRTAVAAAQGGLGLPGLSPQPCTWQPPTSRFSSLAILRPPSIRPPHRKLFLINENGKLGPHITSRDVLGSSSEGRCLGRHNPGSEWPGPGQVLLFPARVSWVYRGNPGPERPWRAARRFAAPTLPPAAEGS